MIDSLYIHIPFCTSKCAYCSFNSYSGLDDLQHSYIDALLQEMEEMASYPQLAPLKTVFLGGGTPSILPPSLLEKLLGFITSHFALDSTAEISIEINPGSVDLAKIDTLLNGGVNRISFGVQSFDDKELQTIGRIHSAKMAEEAITMAATAGCCNLSLDLMYGLPGQSAHSWRSSLKRAAILGTHHLSLYELTVEEGTPFQKMLDDGRLQLPHEEEVERMDAITAVTMEELGMAQYEISNYAREGHECRHNIGYWNNDEYLGVGAGAVSYIAGVRQHNVADPRQYCSRVENGEHLAVQRECLDPRSSFRETVIMGLRMNRGVSVIRLKQRFDIDIIAYYGEKLRDLIATQMLYFQDDFLCLTPRGRLFANRIMAELV
jgi:oxygen-independent coproporphyrinogen-3 oxidase